MRINNIFFITAMYISFILLGIAYFGLTRDWEAISGIALGVYLCFCCLILVFVCDIPKNQMQYFQGNMLRRKNRQVHNSEIYEY